MMRDPYDVVIVGGGPVGLWLSCELRLAGLDVLVIERRTGRINQSRALTIHGRTLEILSLRGIEDRFLAVGKPIMAGHYAVLDTKLDFGIFDSRFPYSLYIPQETTEGLIEDFARELGVEIRRGATVRRLATEDGAVGAFGDGDAPFAVSGRFVIGADGARSIVRPAAGIAFDGHPATGLWFMGDVVLGEPPGASIFSAFNEHGCAMMAPLGDGRHHRIVVNEAADRGVTRDDPVTLEELRTATARIAGTDFGAGQPLWLSRFDNETRLAARYRAGRIFLAGDAAHIHLPAGGQGMNVGIQDAMNLGWKLAAAIQGRGPESLLDTYEAERRPVGVYLHDTTMAQSHLVTAFSPHGRALRGVMNEMLRVPAINRYFANQVSGFGVRYDEALPGFDAAASPLAGSRIRDIPLRLSDGSATRLYALLARGTWLDLTIDPGAAVRRPDWLRGDDVTATTGQPLDHAESLAGAGALLIRPDGYVAQTAPAAAEPSSVRSDEHSSRKEPALGEP